ncbi:MAG: FtsX-like permease family protein [Alphaproteobacteria bacterium]|nr:FtsX-like permease family protein [Alphaproteobacteria bacterium]
MKDDIGQSMILLDDVHLNLASAGGEVNVLRGVSLRIAVGEHVALVVTAAVTLAAGALVLAGAIAAGYRRRTHESVVLKMLGARRRTIFATFAIEYGLLGLASALLAAGIGTAADWLIVTQVMHANWLFLPGRVGLTLVAASRAILALGYAGTWRALVASAAPYLRDQ